MEQKHTGSKQIKTLLQKNGIEARVYYIKTGSLKHNYRITNSKTKWYGNNKLINKFKKLGFVDFDGRELSEYSGNGGMLSIFTKLNKTI